MHRNQGWTIVVWLIMGPAALGATDQAATQADQPSQPLARTDQAEVELKELDQAFVVYVEHRGPYWRMGSVFRQVAEYMAQQDRPGPMFARYLDDPDKVAVQDLRAEVGFFVSGDEAVSEPYRQAVWPAGRAASLAVRGHYGRAPAVYARVFEWIEAQGYQAQGPVTEVYLPTGGQTASERVTEIRVPLAGASVRVEGQPSPAGPQPSAAGQPQPTFVQLDYRAILRSLGDRQSPVPRTAAECMEQVVLRIEAIRRAVAAGYPKRASVVDAYVGPILARPQWRSIEAAADPGGEVAPESADDDEAAALAALLSRLDALLVNVTLRKLEPAEMLAEVARLTGDVCETAGGAGTDADG